MRDKYIKAITCWSTLFWATRLGFPPIPIIGYTAALLTFIKKPKIYLLPCTMFAFTVCTLILHINNPEVDIVKSTVRIILPLMLPCILLPSLITKSDKEVHDSLSIFLWIIITMCMVDFLPYFVDIKGVVLAQLDPYMVKGKTLFFNDGNWSGFFLFSSYSLDRIYVNNKFKNRRLLYFLLTYISGSRSAFGCLLVAESLQAIGLVAKKLCMSNRKTSRLISRFFSQRIVTLAITLFILLLPLYWYLIVQGGEILSGDDINVSLSTSDGSFQTKLIIVRYALQEITNNPVIALIGIGPQVKMESATYSGHNLYGILVEIGILGIIGYILPLLLVIFRCPRTMVIIALLLILQCLSFAPIAYEGPLLLWLYLFCYRNLPAEVRVV